MLLTNLFVNVAELPGEVGAPIEIAAGQGGDGPVGDGVDTPVHQPVLQIGSREAFICGIP